MGSLELKTINIIVKEPKNSILDYSQKRSLVQKSIDNIGHIAAKEYYWDFVDKNHWALSTVLGNKDNIIEGSFEASHNFVYHSYQCEKCDAIFNLPITVDKCIFCQHDKLKTQKKKAVIHKSGTRMGLLTEVNPDLLKMAQEDVMNHQQTSQEPEFDLDWKYLEENV